MSTEWYTGYDIQSGRNYNQKLKFYYMLKLLLLYELSTEQYPHSIQLKQTEVM